MKLRELLKLNGFKCRAMLTTKPDDPICAAVQKFIECDRGSLAVCDEKGALAGIITERDILRKCLSHSDFNPKTVMVRDIMSTQIVIGKPDDDLEYAINAMKQKQVRHMAVVDDQKVIDIISMRDLLGVRLMESDIQLHTMSDYISGVYG